MQDQLKELRTIFSTPYIFNTTQKTRLSDDEFMDIVALMTDSKKDGQHVISGEVVLTLKNGRAIISSNIAIYGNEEDEA